MITKTVIYQDFENGQEVEKEKTVKFMFTLASIRLYEQRTGRLFFDDYSKAVSEFAKKAKEANINSIDSQDVDGLLNVAPILANPEINYFLINALPCLYLQSQNGAYVQNDDTADEAQNSFWLMSLVNFAFFTEIFKELSQNQMKNVKKIDNHKKK